MKGISTQVSGFHPTWFRFLIIVILMLGVFFRFINIDQKLYWYDETYTSLRIAGYTEAEVTQQLNGHEVGIEYLQKYLRTNPEKRLINTIDALALEEPQHVPLYYVMARFWVQWFGNSVAVTRSLSAVISLLVFPCIYWLCLELFKSPLTGWVAIALIAISPFHVFYAQEAREYSLWTVTTLLSSAALLRAMRLKTKLSWVIYAATLTLSLYSYLFSGFVAIAHGIYVFVTERLRLTKTLTAYILASLAGFITFAPWLFFVIANSGQVADTTDWLNSRRSLLFLAKSWVGNLRRFFFDIGMLGSVKSLHIAVESSTIEILIGIVILVIAGYSIYLICCTAPKRAWLFVLTLIAVPAIGLIAPDLIGGGKRSTITRYLIPTYLGFELAIGYLLATQITAVYTNIWRQKLWQLVMVLLVSSGVLSCAISSQAEASSYSGGNSFYFSIASIINQSKHPLLLSDAHIGRVLPLSYLLEPKVQFQFVIEPNIPKIPDGFSDVFLLEDSQSLGIPFSQTLRYRLEKEYNYKTKPVYDPTTLPVDKVWLWRLAQRPQQPS